MFICDPGIHLDYVYFKVKMPESFRMEKDCSTLFQTGKPDSSLEAYFTLSNVVHYMETLKARRT